MVLSRTLPGFNGWHLISFGVSYSNLLEEFGILKKELFDEAFGSLLEDELASLVAEVVGLVLVLARPLGCSLIDGHAAYWILGHVSSGLFPGRYFSKVSAGW